MKSLVPAACLAAAAAVLVTGPAAGRAGPAAGRFGPATGRAGPRRVIAPADLPEAPRRCPEALRGVELALRPFPGGVVLAFTSPRLPQVPELREQLRQAALVIEMYSKAPNLGLAATPDQGRIPPLEISVSDVGAGALVVIRTQRARDLPELLDLARAVELLWSRSDCSEDIFVRRPSLPSLRA